MIHSRHEQDLREHRNRLGGALEMWTREHKEHTKHAPLYFDECIRYKKAIKKAPDHSEAFIDE